MLLLRDVHYVARTGVCRRAQVTEHGIDSAELHADLEWYDLPFSVDPFDPFAVLEACTIAGAEYDAKGPPGTWHTVHDCPRVKP